MAALVYVTGGFNVHAYTWPWPAWQRGGPRVSGPQQRGPPQRGPQTPGGPWILHAAQNMDGSVNEMQKNQPEGVIFFRSPVYIQ